MFVNFAQPQQQSVTTLALGEEGGGSASTRALGEEGGVTSQMIGEEGGGTATTLALGEEGGQNPGTVTTLALGEEGGGGVTSQALGEEGGGTATTLALGEEGGGGVTSAALFEEGGGGATTLALGEEGGGAQGIPTNAFNAVLSRSDFNGNRDGQMSIAELQQGAQSIQRELTDLENIRFIQAPGPEFEQKLQSLRQQRDAANLMLNNFNGISRQDGLQGQISGTDIYRTAALDGNTTSISNQDVARLGGLPNQNAFSLSEVQQVFQRADVSGRPGPTDAPTADGHLTQREIQNRLAQLESIVNIQFDPQREREIQVLRYLNQNFNAIAGPDLHQESVFGPQQPRPVQSITQQELAQVAARDGNVNVLSDADLAQRPPVFPPQFPQVFQLFSQIFQLFLQLLGRR